jgi:hypothetical protein
VATAAQVAAEVAGHQVAILEQVVQDLTQEEILLDM